MIELYLHQQRVIEDALPKARSVYAVGTGLGKTIIILSLCYLRTGPQLILTKAPLVTQAFKKDCETHFKDSVTLTDFDADATTYDGVYISSYEYYRLHHKKFKCVPWTAVYLDECHVIANRGSGMSKTVLGDWKRSGGLKADHIHGFTGTLIPNRYEQVFPLLRLAGLDRTWGSFQSEYFYVPVPTIPHFIKFIKAKEDDYMALIKQHIYRVDRSEVDLGEKKHFYYPVSMGAEQKIAHDALLKEGVYKDVILDYNIQKFVRLRQVTSGFLPMSINDGYDFPNNRLIQLKNVLHNIMKRATHAICFYTFNYDRDQLATFKDIVVMYNIHGEVSKIRRNIIIEMWRSLGGLLVMQICCGKNGLTLTEASDIIYYNLLDNNEAYEQSQDRINRIGMTSTESRYHYIYCKDSIYEQIIRALEKKSDIGRSLKNWYRRESTAHTINPPVLKIKNLGGFVARHTASGPEVDNVSSNSSYQYAAIELGLDSLQVRGSEGYAGLDRAVPEGSSSVDRSQEGQGPAVRDTDSETPTT